MSNGQRSTRLHNVAPPGNLLGHRSLYGTIFFSTARGKKENKKFVPTERVVNGKFSYEPDIAPRFCYDYDAT